MVTFKNDTLRAETDEELSNQTNEPLDSDIVDSLVLADLNGQDIYWRLRDLGGPGTPRFCLEIVEVAGTELIHFGVDVTDIINLAQWFVSLALQAAATHGKGRAVARLRRKLSKLID